MSNLVFVCLLACLWQVACNWLCRPDWPSLPKIHHWGPSFRLSKIHLPLNTGIKGHMPSCLATTSNFKLSTYSPGCRELKTTLELMNYKCGLAYYCEWMSSQKVQYLRMLEIRNRLPRPKRFSRWNLNVTYLITMECSSTAIRQKWVDTKNTLCKNLLAFKNKFKCLQKEMCRSQRIKNTSGHGSTYLYINLVFGK